jgi:hypothetical protein
MKPPIWLSAGLLLGALLATPLAGCATQPGEGAANPYPPVPDMIQETVSKPPVTTDPLLWQPGHWDWNGDGYIWAPGQWVPAQGHGRMWMPGWWAKRPNGWQWQPPHWTS